MKDARMSRTSTFFLQAVIVLFGIGILAFLLWEPHVEGVNANATTLSEIYFDDPLLAYAYIASVPFFIALYQAFKLLGAAGQNNVFTQRSVKALQTIKYCAIVMIPLIVIGVVWILSQESDDRPPILAMGTLTSIASIIVASMANVLERKVQRSLRMS